MFKHRLLDIHAYDGVGEDYQEAKYLPVRKVTINFPDFTNFLPEVVHEGSLLLKHEAVKRKLWA